METLKHPACTVGWVARLCRSWLFPGKATRIFPGSNPKWGIRVGISSRESIPLFQAKDQSTVAQRAEATVRKRSLASYV